MSTAESSKSATADLSPSNSVDQSQEQQLNRLSIQRQVEESECILSNERSDEDEQLLLGVRHIFNNISIGGSAVAHLGDVIYQNITQINCQYFSQPHDPDCKCRESLAKLEDTIERTRQDVRTGKARQQDDTGLDSLTILQSHDSDTTLSEDIPLDWLSDHIFEDFTCDISKCICECHRSKRVTKESIFGRGIYIKEARFDRLHKCERDGKIDYIRTIAFWLPEWMATKRLVQVTKNRNLGAWWLPNLPKLVGDQEIFHYASTGNKVALQQLLRGSTKTKGMRFDPNVIRQENGWTPLHFALEAGHYDICDTLIKAGAKPNMETSSFSTAAYLAATKILINYSNPQIRKTLAKTFSGKLEYERFKFSKLHKIVIFKPSDAVRQINLLKESELRSLLKSTDRAGRTALCWAAQLNCWDIVRLLLQRGADIAHQDFGGNTPFHFASQAVGPFALGQLLTFNPRETHRYVSIKNKGGWQPLHHAAHYQNDPQFAHILVQAGASVSAETNAGKTPIMMAALMQRPDVIRYLHGNRADVNHQDRAGWTALSLAIENADVSLETVDALLDAKVRLDGQSVRRESILHLVAKMPSLKVIEHLGCKARGRRGHGNRLGYVDAEAQNSQGLTARQLLMEGKPVEEVERAFDTLLDLMDASRVASADFTG